MRKPLLTIAIPTYNRAVFLDLCLKRLHEEIKGLSADFRKKIVLYISNNASNDATDSIIQKWDFSELCEMKCRNNVINIGAEENVLQCYRDAKSKYVWIVGDDDVILVDGLRLVLQALEMDDFDIVYLSGYGFKANYLEEPRRGRNKSGVLKYTDAVAFVKKTNVMLTFITALVVRCDIDLSNVKQITLGSNLPQLGWVFQLIRDGRRFAIVKNRIYAAKIGNAASYGAVEIFGRNLLDIASKIMGEVKGAVSSLENGTIVNWFPVYLMDLRDGAKTYQKEDVFDGMNEIFGRNWRYYLFLVPLIHLPVSLARIYFQILRVTRLTLNSIII